MKTLTLICFFAVCLASCLAMPYPMAYPIAFAYPDDVGYGPPVHKPAPSHYGKEVLGRVKIQAYRGPNQGKEHGHYEAFAPFGYYVTQPQDSHKKHYH